MTTTLEPDVRALIELALNEDIGTGDITSLATIPADRTATAVMLAKQDGVLSGMDVAESVFHTVDPSIEFEALKSNGESVSNPERIAIVRGNARNILTAERTALNFVQRLSGVATITAEYVTAIAGTKARIVDTRKTTPGMRLLQKRAVQHGGGSNHRFGLADGVLIKDNHLAAIGGAHRISDAISAARATAPHTLKIEVEVTNLDELREALDAGADIVMLDNMDTITMAEAVVIRDAHRNHALLEASGGITLSRLPEIAATGIDLISSGALTHSAPSLDISLDITLN
ncbi:MAG: carboxylating nicotinate-nucleotide diphosphorylase [Thermomicrobiales bacterium]|nr:carboxylating nicotinate-nucleotide diphosphorylase [Thermomicrobiales bacterium]MCO5224394.1 carboxylating nicotinate-nucleotide diphosphorylase [Thermomicrobiales bacterium]